MIRGVDDDILGDITGDDGALGGGTIVMLDGETRRHATRGGHGDKLPAAPSAVRGEEGFFNHYMGVIVMFC